MKALNSFCDWWKQEKRYRKFWSALILALLPYLCCVVRTALDGGSIGKVYLPSSEWNDELFYYKQVESILQFGFPQGFYGFNESHGLVLSFAAWSPVLILPWILWGLLFGWTLLSPVICNILLMSAALFLFVWMAEPEGKQLSVLAFLFCLYTPFTRYMMSGMPEIICISHLIVFYGLAYNYQKEEKGWKLAVLFLLSGLLTLMRPYMILFLLLPVFFWIRSTKRQGKIWKGILGSCVVMGVVLGLYAAIKHYFGAEYFHPLFFTDWITTFFTDGFGAGAHNFFSTLYWKGKDFYAHTREGIRSGLASGAFFAGFMVTLLILLWQTVSDMRWLRKQERSGKELPGKVRAQLVVEAHLAFSFVGMFFALLLMYKLTEGSKHLLTFMAVGVFVIAMMRTAAFKKAVILGAVFAYLYLYRAVEPYDYSVPYQTQDRVEQVESWRESFAEALQLDREGVPNYENVVIWVFNETNPEGQAMKWQMLYALPEGFGISCCQKAYVLEHIDTLESRYILAQNGAEVDTACRKLGYQELSRDEDLVLYQRY